MGVLLCVLGSSQLEYPFLALTQNLLHHLADAALAKCRTMGYKIAVSVVDRDGLPVIMMYEEGAGLNTREGSDRKAYTAAAFHAPSAAFVKRMHDKSGLRRLDPI